MLVVNGGVGIIGVFMVYTVPHALTLITELPSLQFTITISYILYIFVLRLGNILGS